MTTLADKFKTAYVNRTDWETMEQVARDHLTDELFKAAASLLDPRTRLQTESNEYHRALAELVQRFTGSDDFDDVVDIISERTGVYRVTAADFGTGINGDPLYIGPLEPALAFIKQECTWEVTQTADDKVRVDLDGGNCFGVADTPEMAWRYAVAAELVGNSIENFTPFLLK